MEQGKKITVITSDMANSESLQNTNNLSLNKHYSRGCAMFDEAIIYFPKDEKIVKQITKDIAAFHSAVAVKYMDSTLELTPKQKVVLLGELMQDIEQQQISV